MARFNMSEADNYGNSSNSGSFFTLKDDKDTAKVRFLYNSIDDVEGYAVHRVAVGTRQDGQPNERYVNCLRNYNDPIEKCPFCSAQLKVMPKLFLKLYNEDAKECQIWERGKTYFQRMASLSNRYKPLYNEIIEIERNGKKGDMKTDYVFYPIENVPTNLDDYECADPLGTIILDKSYEDMETYLQTGGFPSDSASVTQERVNSETPWDNRGGETRRTPSNNETPRRRAF